MNNALAQLSSKYAEALRTYLGREDEFNLEHAYELGRTAIAEGFGVLDMVKLHQQAVVIVGLPLRVEDDARLVQAAGLFFMEALSPFEATHRGFRETYEKLRQLNQTLERRNVELAEINREMSKRERQLAEAQRLACLGSWEWDILNNKVNWSDELFRIYGRRREEIETTFESWLNCVHNDDRTRAQRAIENAIRDRTPFSFQERIVRPDGEIRDLHSQGELVLDASGKPTRLVGFCQDITERLRAEEALKESKEHYYRLFQQARQMEDNLRHLSNRILYAQEEERTRISRELHDDVGQVLTAINVNLAVLKKLAGQLDATVRERIEDTQSLQEQAMETIHRFARELRPAALDDLGLLPALRSYLKSFAERTSMRTRFRATPAVETLDAERKTVIYRVTQESLNNISKHARATQVNVTVRKLGKRVLLEVKDNGRGFPVESGAAEASRTCLGLLGMQERARLVDGEFFIESAPGRGTTVRVEIPFKSDSAVIDGNKTRRGAVFAGSPPSLQ